MKLCDKNCKHNQSYNAEWRVCWHPKVKGSKTNAKACIVELAKNAGKKG